VGFLFVVSVAIVVGERRGFVACWTGEFVGVFDRAFGEAGEEGLFGCELFFLRAVFVFVFADARQGFFVSKCWEEGGGWR